jgi:hypothetical protein
MSAFASCGHEYTRGYAHVVCAMSRVATERDDKLFFSKKRKSKERKSKDRKKKNTTEILHLRKTDRGSKDVASLSIRVVLSKESGRTSYRNPGSCRSAHFEFERFTFGYRADGIAPIQNKIGAFLADPLLNRILTAPGKDLHIRRIMDGGGVLLVNLAKGRLGEDSSALLGGLLVTTIGLAAFSRADTPLQKRRDFFV